MKKHRLCLSDADIEARLKEAGINPTAQRIAICRYILCEADHPTADRIKLWADENFPKISMATVYNTLKTLVDAGLIREFKFPHSDSAVYDQNTSLHYHFLDEKTGELIDVEAAQVEINVTLKKGFKINGISVLLKGTRL